ncbi:hypothetical protein ACET3Z_029300 [Daucus carota]
MARICYLVILLVVTAHIMVKKGEASICGEPALKTRAERREYCSCAHSVISQYPDSAARIPRIDSLPEKCGLPFLFSGDPKFDCNTIN